VSFLMAPRYEATARVMFTNVFKADPITGAGADPGMLGSYLDTQRELIKDYRVTGPVVSRLRWLSDPSRITQYQGRPANDNRDFNHWLAQQVADRVTTRPVSATIMEIGFSSPSATEAKEGAEALRESYFDYTLASRRQDALRNAQWFAGQAEKARQAADEAQLAKANFERANGIVMQGDQAGAQQDVESARLSALVNQATSAPVAMLSAPVTVSSGSSLQLAQIDAALAQNADKLGPNHPQMQQLRAQRALVASVVAKEAAAARAGPSNTALVGQIARELQQQKSKVIGERDKIEQLRQLQSEVDLRREQYKKTAARAADLTLESGIADSGLSSIGVVVTPNRPSFPNKTLIVGGALGLGAGLGLTLAVLVELLNRRVRGVEDLDFGRNLNCLATIGAARPKRRSNPKMQAQQMTNAEAGA
jgi:succinoglycan biosynthesis transport protein ExoP